MMPMMTEGMNPDVGPPHPGMMNKKHFPPGEANRPLYICLTLQALRDVHENMKTVTQMLRLHHFPKTLGHSSFQSSIETDVLLVFA